MAILPLYGHHEIRQRLSNAFVNKSLPGSLLLQGPRGIGKQRLALWLGQLLLCETASQSTAATSLQACGQCRACRFVSELSHPDLHWFFPRPRLKDADDLEKVRADHAEAMAERAASSGLYAQSSGMDAIYFDVVRVIVQAAVMSPALARRKVFVIGDAERMVSQEGKEEGANAFLKLLEEPPADTSIILTSSEPGALLPTVRSRVVTLRLAPLRAADVRAFLADPAVAKHLTGDDTLPATPEERVQFAAGAPGRLVSGADWAFATESAKRMLDSIAGKPSARYEAAWTTASTKARGGFADTLDALTALLHDRARAATVSGAQPIALATARAIEVVEVAKERVEANVSPQLITVNLLRDLQELMA